MRLNVSEKHFVYSQCLVFFCFIFCLNYINFEWKIIRFRIDHEICLMNQFGGLKWSFFVMKFWDSLKKKCWMVRCKLRYTFFDRRRVWRKWNSEICPDIAIIFVSGFIVYSFCVLCSCVHVCSNAYQTELITRHAKCADK